MQKLFTAACFVALMAGSAQAQEVSAEELKVAKRAIAATMATQSFDRILPQTAIGLKNQLSQANPDRAEEIDVIVNEEALKLAPRRGDLETEAATLFTKSFNTEELTAIADFFATPTGKKYLESTPFIARELQKAARVWSNGIRRDMTEAAQKRLSASE